MNWIESSFCECSACVQVGFRTVCDSSACVEVNTTPEAVYVRDSKDPDGHVLVYTLGGWAELVELIKSGGETAHDLDGQFFPLRFDLAEREAFVKGVQAGEFDPSIESTDACIEPESPAARLRRDVEKHLRRIAAHDEPRWDVAAAQLIDVVRDGLLLADTRSETVGDFEAWLVAELRDAGCEIRTLSPEGMARITVQRLIRDGWSVIPSPPLAGVPVPSEPPREVEVCHDCGMGYSCAKHDPAPSGTPEETRRCRVEYERPGGREHGDRIVRCHLPAGHPGEHEEDGTEVTWAAEREETRDA